VGLTATHEVQAGDDAFDQYRKRMQLAYRSRPNPLNNPRRDYY
jgi:splicing factor 4